MPAFRMAVALGANGIETDVRQTEDGVLVLFHDETALRFTGRGDQIASLTFEDLAQIRVPSPDGRAFGEIPTLAEFLAFAAEAGVYLALEIKADGIEPALAEAVRAFGVKEKTAVTSFDLRHLENVKALDPGQRVGLLTAAVTDEEIRSLKRIGAEQICPKAGALTPELVARLHAEGFSVRAWGVKNEEDMAFVCRCGADGMTVNFPDKLRDYLIALSG